MSEWRRLHPATPVLRGGLGLLAVLGVLLANFRDRLIGWVLPELEAPGPDDDPLHWAIEFGLLWVVLGAAGVTLLAIAGFWFSWRMHSYRLTEELVELRSGILFRSHRQARLDRVQAVNVVRPFIAGLFGLGKLELTGAGLAGLQLAYLRLADAEALRAEVLDRASGATAVEGAAALDGAAAGPAAGAAAAAGAQPSAPPLIGIPIGRLIGAVLLSVPMLLLTAATALVLGLAGSGAAPEWAPFLVLPAGLGVIGTLWSRISIAARYRLSADADGVRLRSGLLTTRVESLPPGRVHALRIVQPVLWRPFGWWRVEVTRANQLRQDAGGSGLGAAALPVGTADDAVLLAGLLLPGLDAEPELLAAGMSGSGDDDGFVRSPPRMRLRRWWGLRRTGVRLDAERVLLRSGVLRRSLTIVPLARLQSAAVEAGPLLRLQRGAGVRFHVVPGAITPRIRALDAADAEAVLEQTARAAIAAIAADSAHRWRQRPAGAPGAPLTARAAAASDAAEGSAS